MTKLPFENTPEKPYPETEYVVPLQSFSVDATTRAMILQGIQFEFCMYANADGTKMTFGIKTRNPVAVGAKLAGKTIISELKETEKPNNERGDKEMKYHEVTS